MLIDMNYKEMDTQRIIDYIGTFANGVSVDDIILHSGADKLRVYPCLLYTSVIAFAEKHRIKKIVFTSSIAPYGAAEALKEETTIPMPNTPYGISKLVAEKIHVIWQSRKTDERQLTIVRPGVVFGKGENGKDVYKRQDKASLICYSCKHIYHYRIRNESAARKFDKRIVENFLALYKEYMKYVDYIGDKAVSYTHLLFNIVYRNNH